MLKWFRRKKPFEKLSLEEQINNVKEKINIVEELINDRKGYKRETIELYTKIIWDALKREQDEPVKHCEGTKDLDYNSRLSRFMRPPRFKYEYIPSPKFTSISLECTWILVYKIDLCNAELVRLYKREATYKDIMTILEFDKLEKELGKLPNSLLKIKEDIISKRKFENYIYKNCMQNAKLSYQTQD